MKMANPIEASGYFYLPEMPAEKMLGTLRISIHGEITLDITYLSSNIDWKKKIFGVMPEKGAYMESIVGDVKIEESIAGDAEIKRDYDVVSLQRCRCTEWGIISGDFDSGMSISLTFLAQICFIGAKYDTGADASFSKIVFSVEGINEWIGSGIAVRPIPRGNNPLAGISVNYTPPEPIEIHLYNGMNLQFHARWSGPILGQVVSKVEISQHWSVHLICEEPHSVDSLLNVVSRIRNFLYFAMDKITYLKFIRGYSPAHKVIYGANRKTELKTISVHYKSSPMEPEEIKTPWYHMLFPYSWVRCDLEKLLNQWLIEHERHDSAFNLYFDVRSGIYLQSETRFLSLVQSIESLHRKMCRDATSSANEIPLRHRLTSMLGEFADLYGEKKKRKTLIKSIIATRNYLTHRDDEMKGKSAKGQDLFVLHEKLEALFQLQILRLIGMDSATIFKIVENNRSIQGKLGRNP